MNRKSIEKMAERAATANVDTTVIKQTEKIGLKSQKSVVLDTRSELVETIQDTEQKKRNVVSFRGQNHGFNCHVSVKVKVSFKRKRVMRRLPVELRIGYARITRRRVGKEQSKHENHVEIEKNRSLENESISSIGHWESSTINRDLGKLI